MFNITDTYPRVRHCRLLETPVGTTWGPRTIPDFELIFVMEGCHHYIDAQGLTQAQPGDIITIAPHQEHVFRCESGPAMGKHACAHFDLLDSDGQVISLLDQRDFQWQRVARVDDTSYARTLFEQAATAFASYGKHHLDIVNATIRLIWLQVVQKWSSSHVETVSETIENMIAFIRANLFRPINRQDIARYLRYTPEHVNYLFKKELGMTPSRFINRERVLAAFNLLHEGDTNMTVDEVARRCGFSSPYYFCRVFKDIFGHSPGRIKQHLHRRLIGSSQETESLTIATHRD